MQRAGLPLNREGLIYCTEMSLYINIRIAGENEFPRTLSSIRVYIYVQCIYTVTPEINAVSY